MDTSPIVGTRRDQDSTSTSSNPYERLRHRAVLREADLRDLLFERSKRSTKRRDLRHLRADRFDATPHLLAYVAEHNGFPPTVRRGSAAQSRATRERIDAMASCSGELVFVTSICTYLRGRALKTMATAAAWREGHRHLLDVIAPNAVAFTAALQSGGQTGHLHDHTVLPLSALRHDLQVFALSAPSGAGGGAIHPESGLHFVRIGSTATDRAKVASYLSRDPDGRFDLPDNHPDFFQAHEEALIRKQDKQRSPRLTYHHLPSSWRT